MGIGTLGEKSLHRELKYLYQPDPAATKCGVGRLIADAQDPEGGVLEVQTGHFFALKKPAACLFAGRAGALGVPGPNENGCAG